MTKMSRAVKKPKKKKPNYGGYGVLDQVIRSAGTMTKDEALAWVERIRTMRGDDEAAHGAEDDLRAAVLRAIADGSPDAVELARVALTTDDIDFARWCA